VRRGFDRDDADTVIELVTHLAYEAFFRRPEALTWIEEAAARWGDRPGAHRHELLGAAALAAWTNVDVPKALRLGSLALAADPDPGGALDCLPENGAIGAFVYAKRFEEALATARRAVLRLGTGSDRWTLALMHANVVTGLAISGTGTLNDELERSAQEAVTVAHSVGNPTIIAQAYWASGVGLGATDPALARAALESARAYASEVDNRWVLNVTALIVATVPLHAEADEADLAMLIDAADDLHRTGWPAHAWNAMWGAIGVLFGLGRMEAAAVVLGGCEASGVSSFARQEVPADLEDDSSPTASFRHLGRHLAFDDLVAIAAGRRPLPMVP
jgi:hypothetical protein